MSEFNSCLRRGFVQFGDDFNTVAEVTGVFGRNAKKLPYRISFGVPGKPAAVVCLYSEDGGEGWHNERKFGPAIDARGWNEVLSVVEWNDDLETSKARIEEELVNPKTHYVFYRESRQGSLWYKFYGEFRIDPESTRATLSTDRPAVVYRRTSKTVECLKVEEVHQTFTQEELDDFVGCPVTVKFLDEIPFVADFGEKVEGCVAVMPGAELFVNAVNRAAGTVACGSNDEALLKSVKLHVPAGLREKVSARTVSLTVPIKDFGLGYLFARYCAEKEMFGKVVEVKRPFSVYYSVYYYAPFSGGNEIVAEPGTRFKIVGAWGDDAYECSTEDGEFEEAAEEAELKRVKPFIRMRFGHIDGFKLPASLLKDGTVEVVSVAELEDTEVPGGEEEESDDGEEPEDEFDAEDWFGGGEEDDEEDREKVVCGYPDGYAHGTPRGEYCVIDLSPSAEGGGPLKYPVSFMDKMPEGGWTDEYKTTKIVLKLIKGGEFMMGTEKDEEIRAVNPPHKVKLPNDFYMGVFPVTRRQCEIIFGSCTPASKWPEDDDGKHPVYGVPYTEIRGYVRGCGWPENAGVDYCSFLLALRVSSGIMNLDLPTAAQWEYACKAGAGEMEEDDLKGTAWFNDNSGGRVHPVGMLRPNRWGLYDMLGNVWEWCLDWYGRVTPEVWDESDTFTAPAGVLPLFPSRRMLFPFMSPSAGYAREIRGGGWNTDARNCHASSRASSGPSRGYDFVGFRLSFTLAAERSDTSPVPEKKPADANPSRTADASAPSA